MASVKEERERLIGELMECERQIVLWERKITLETETQEALDPTVGAAELASMSKDIARMRTRYEAVKREQERLVTAMELAIEKREVIALKNKAVPTAVVTGTGATAKSLSASRTLGATAMRGGGSAGGVAGERAPTRSPPLPSSFPRSPSHVRVRSQTVAAAAASGCGSVRRRCGRSCRSG